MLIRCLLLFGLLVATDVGAGVINVEFKFTPFTGDPAAADLVETVPGHVAVFVNNIPVAEQEIGREEVPVLFEEREIAASIWLPTESLGGMLRKGTNVIRIEFEPVDGKEPYRAQLRWAQVIDETTESEKDGKSSATNQAGEGVDDRKVTGRVVMESKFEAEFATDRPWHHYPAITALTEDDRKQILSLLADRAAAFKPGFEMIYKILESNAGVDLTALKEEGCLDKAHEAGIRVVAVPSDGIEMLTTGQAEVVVQAREGQLFVPEDPAALEKITDGDTQMCIGMALFGVYPPRLVLVKSKDGAWVVAY
ncbi:MAG: hypothetical protein SGI90_14365 [Candidatus Eisenbacteria bacterium]|nr:hypothetical protein [Candidatus Eisenbacteria bacterium]